MAGIYIHGLSVSPDDCRKRNIEIVFDADGDPMAIVSGEKTDEFLPVEIVQDHGRLGDLDALFKEVEYGRDHHTHTDGLAALHHRTEYNHFLRVISCAPTFLQPDMQES